MTIAADKRRQLNDLIDTPRSVAALAFAVSLGGHDPTKILAGSGISWISPDGVSISRQRLPGVEPYIVKDFVKLRQLAAKLIDYADLLELIANAGIRELGEDQA